MKRTHRYVIKSKRHTDKQPDGRADTQTDRQTNEQTGRKAADRKTDRADVSLQTEKAGKRIDINDTKSRRQQGRLPR